jgi:hypothetical protein
MRLSAHPATRPRAWQGGRLSLLRLQDYAQDALANPDVTAAVRLMRVEPVLSANSMPQSAPAG